MTANKLTLKYLVALTIIAMLATGSYFLLHYHINAEKSSAALVNISGRQRMLTQKIAVLGLQLAAFPHEERNKLRTEMVQQIRLMQQSHEELTGAANDGINNNPSVASEIYFGTQVQLDLKVRTFLSTAEALSQTPDEDLNLSNAHLKYIIGPPAQQLLEALDALVAQHQADSEARIARLEALERTTLGFTFLTLLLEALLIFRPMVRTIVQEKRDLLEANEQLHRLSTTDGLTGIANRRWFDEFFERQWQNAKRCRTSLALIMIDVDYFKAYNDTYGHEQGDQCLKLVARALAAAIKRPNDFVARFGGEEFAVVLSDIDLNGLAKVAEALRASVEAQRIEHCQTITGKVVTISLGAVFMKTGDELSTKDLIIAADKALYKAKHDGRNRCQIAD